MDQAVWNLLFFWITGEQCFIPEGCPPPVEGVIAYVLVAAVIAAGGYWVYRRRL